MQEHYKYIVWSFVISVLLYFLTSYAIPLGIMYTSESIKKHCKHIKRNLLSLFTVTDEGHTTETFYITLKFLIF